MVLAFILPPFLGFLWNAFYFKSPNKNLAGGIGSGACFLSFLFLVFYIWNFGFESISVFLLPWFSAGDLTVSFSLTADSLSLLMSLLITGVGSLIHLYSWSYMSGDPGFSRYFSYLNLFVFMMLVLVLADNLPLLFVGWEGVGLCSYLLIGFWFKEKTKVYAGMMAFLTNRITDACFLMGIFLLFSHFGTVQFSELNALDFHTSPHALSLGKWGAGLLFLGAIGKSAQIPFHFWLPEAMAGPTPVSALIHAATMVTAGVYLLVRLSLFYSNFPDLLTVIGWLGALTAFITALIAARQWDFKKVLAYSTISQLAYLFMAVGIQAFSSSVFHLLTHGFFKALLFLCAGSVIHALKGEQDIRKMGGLKKSMPLTFFTYLAGALALMALPPFSGFFSKDEILWSLLTGRHYGLFLMAFLTGILTVFYMTRLTVFVFFGKSQVQGSVHESPGGMIFPLVVLAILSLTGGLLGIPHLFSEFSNLHLPHLLQNLLHSFSPVEFKGSAQLELLMMLISTLTSGAVITITGAFYLKKQKKEEPPVFWKKLLEEAFFVPKWMTADVPAFFTKSARHIARQIEQGFFQRGIEALIFWVLSLRQQFAFLQNGNFQSYALYFVIGSSVLMVLIFLR